MLIPDMKINTDQLKKTNKVCPISGCTANNNATIKRQSFEVSETQKSREY